MGCDTVRRQLARLAVLIAACVSVLSAQTNTSAIAGQIKDASGASVASATVTVTAIITVTAATGPKKHTSYTTTSTITL